MPSPEADFLPAVDAWCQWLQVNHGRSAATASKYRHALHRFNAWVTNPPKEAALAPADTRDPLQPTLGDLERFSGIYAHSMKLSPRARRPLISALRGFYAWLSSTTGGHNPAQALPQPKAGRALPKAMQLRDAEKLLMQPDITTFIGLRDACILLLFMGCGFRLGGLLALNESALVWYDDENGRECLVIRVVEKGQHERLQPVPAEAAMLLRAYLGHEDLGSIPRSLPSGDRVLFVTVNNRAISPAEYFGEERRISARYVQDMITARCAAAGVPDDVAHPHALRHMFGAELAEEEVHELTHQALMGHATIDSTKIYAHLAIRKLRRAIDLSSPVAKMRGPLLDSLRSLDLALSPPKRVHASTRRRVET